MRDDGPLDLRPHLLLVHGREQTRRAVAAALVALPIAIAIAASCAEARARSERFAVAIYADRLADGFGDELALSMKGSGQVHVCSSCRHRRMLTCSRGFALSARSSFRTSTVSSRSGLK
jgi:hypothetical protein